MVDIQNEIKYCAAWQIIRNLLLEGAITREEFDAANEILARKFRPLAVRGL
jgi:BMFP domain-containing protein YqiC